MTVSNPWLLSLRPLAAWQAPAARMRRVSRAARTTHPDHPPAKVLTQSAGTDQNYAQIQSWAELALLHDPLNARAFRILGQISDLTSDEEQTETLMQAATRRSLLESVAIYWMTQKSYQAQDYHAALGYADTLLRTRPQALPLITPLFGKIAENPDASDELKQLLASNPPWRPQFFGSFPASISDARTPLDMLLSLKDTPNPPTAEDLRAYLTFLIQHKFYELAYYTWLQFLPRRAVGQGWPFVQWQLRGDSLRAAV